MRWRSDRISCRRSISQNARYVISFGADFLGTWNSAVAQSAAYGRMRQGGTGVRPKFVHVDARLSQTAANADEFVACKPGTEGLLAMAIAGARRQERRGATDYTPEKVAEKTGVPADKIERLAREFAAQCARGRDHRRRAAGAHQRPVPGAGGQRP